MIERKTRREGGSFFSFLNEKVYSLRTKLLLLILTSTLIAGGAYLIVRFSILSVVDTFYFNEEKKAERGSAYLSDLQEYIIENEINATKLQEITSWVRKNKYVYLALYSGDELLFDMIGAPSGGHGLIGDASGGFTVDYPSREELLRYAAEKGFGVVTLSDGDDLYVSLTEFTEYFYYDLANIVSLAAAVLVITAILMTYYGGLSRRISRLTEDVSLVSEGDIKHAVRTDDAQDELSKLSENVEKMRTSLLKTLDGERKAMEMNRELITSMSHDIRTPLTVLLGYMDVMKLYAQKDEALSDYIAASEATAVRLKELSDGMFRYFLAFGGSEPELQSAAYDADTLFSQMLSEHVIFMREKGYRVEYSVVGDSYGDAEVVLDAPYLARIFDNIFSNLAKYADKEEPITIHGSIDGDNIYLRFENKIVENDKAESTGIGVRTCRRIADAMKIGFFTDVCDGRYITTLSVPYSEKKGDDTGVV